MVERGPQFLRCPARPAASSASLAMRETPAPGVSDTWPPVLLDGGQWGAQRTCSQHPPGRHRPVPVASTPQFRNNFKVQTSTPSEPPPVQLLVSEPSREQGGLTASRILLLSALLLRHRETGHEAFGGL